MINLNKPAMKKILSKKRIALAVLTTFLFYLFYPPLASLSQLGQLTISPNKNIQDSEIPEYIYEHLNKDFSAYFGKTNNKDLTYLNFQSQNRTIEMELIPGFDSKDKKSTDSASEQPIPTPTQTVTPSPTIQPTISPSPTPSDLTQEASTISADIKAQLEEIQQSVASISGKVEEVSSQAGEISKEVKKVVKTELVLNKSPDGDTLTFKNADENTDVVISPNFDFIKQNIIINSSIYNWPLKFSINVNGLLINQNKLGEFQFTEVDTNKPIFTLDSFKISSEVSGVNEPLVPQYSVENGKFTVSLLPSVSFLDNLSVKAPLNIEYLIKPVINDNKDVTKKTQYKEIGNVISSKSVKMSFSDKDSSYKYVLDRTDFKAKLFDKSDKYAFAFERNNKSVELSLANSPTLSITKSTVKMDENDVDKLEAKNVVNNIDLRYTPNLQGIKEEIILNDKNSVVGFQKEDFISQGSTISGSLIPLSFSMKLNGLEITRNEQDKIQFFDPTNNTILFHIEKPFARDSNQAESYDVSYKIGSNNNLSIVIDKNWLESPDRVFPIIIDPTFLASEMTHYITATDYSFQRKSWFDGTYYWIALQTGSGIITGYSSDGGATWAQGAASLAIASYDYDETIDTARTNTSTASYSDFTANTYTCEKVTAGIPGKISHVRSYFGVSTTMIGLVIKQTSGGACTSPGGNLSARTSHYVHWGAGGTTYDFYFGNEAGPFAKGDSYCLCAVSETTGKHWYGSSSSNHYKVIYMRQQNADFSVYGDETGAYIVYQDGDSNIQAAKSTGTYPGTSWTWGTPAVIYDGGEGTNFRFDRPTINKAGNLLVYTAMRSGYGGGPISDKQDTQGTTGGMPYNVYSSTIYTPYSPSQDGKLSGIDINITSVTNSPTIWAKLCYDTTDASGCNLDEGSLSINSTGIKTITFPNGPFVQAEKRYRIYFRFSVGGANAVFGIVCATGEQCDGGHTYPAPAEAGIGGNGIKIWTRTATVIVVRKTDLNLGSITGMGSRALSDVANATASSYTVSVNKNDQIQYFFKDWANIKRFWCSTDGSDCSAVTQATGSSKTHPDADASISSVTDNTGKTHLVYINSSGNLVYQSLSSDFLTMSAVETVDSNTDCRYPSISFGEGNNSVFVTYFRESNNTIYYSRRPLNFETWSTPVALNSSITGSTQAWLSTLLNSSEQIVVFRTYGSSPPYSIVTDMIDTGLNKLMRHGKSFENETEQPATY